MRITISIHKSCILKMFRAYLIAAFIAVASAFAPVARVASRISISKMAPAQMAPTDAVVESTMSKFSQVLASETDFGGYTGPIICLVLIGAFILSLNPPLEGSDNKSRL